MNSPAAKHGHEVRQRLLAAAVQLVGESGWTGVSTRSLARHAGVAASVVHYHYPSVQALLREAVTAASQQALAEVEAVLDTADTATAIVDALVSSVDGYTGNDPLSRTLMEAYLAADRDALLRDGIVDVIAGLRDSLEGRLASCGVPHADHTAAVLLATLDGLLLHRGLGHGPTAADAAAVLHRLVNTQPVDTTDTEEEIP